MNTNSEPPRHDDLSELRREVETELSLIVSYPIDIAEPVTSWSVEPADVERTATGLHSLLGAIQALGDALPMVPRPRSDPA